VTTTSEAAAVRGLRPARWGGLRATWTGTLYSEYIIIYVHSYIILLYYHTKFGPLSVNIASAVEHNRGSCGARAPFGKVENITKKKKQNAILDNVKTVVDFIIIYIIVIIIIRGVVDSARYRVYGNRK
jgi:hypothetical protein